MIGPSATGAERQRTKSVENMRRIKMRADRFQKGSGGYICQDCGRRTRSTGRGDNENVELCVDCYEIEGFRNEHLDGLHELLHPGCPECNNK